MKHLVRYRIFESSGPLQPGRWSWTKDLTIPRDMQEDIHDMSWELVDSGYYISYQWWPPYEKGSKLYEGNKYPYISITKRGHRFPVLALIRYDSDIKEFIERLKFYLSDRNYNCVVKFKGMSGNIYNRMDFMIDRGFTDIETQEFKIEMISKSVYGDVYE